MERFFINGGDITTSGIDWFAQYDPWQHSPFGRMLKVGLSYTM